MWSIDLYIANVPELGTFVADRHAFVYFLLNSAFPGRTLCVPVVMYYRERIALRHSESDSAVDASAAQIIHSLQITHLHWSSRAGECRALRVPLLTLRQV